MKDLVKPSIRILSVLLGLALASSAYGQDTLRLSTPTFSSLKLKKFTLDSSVVPTSLMLQQFDYNKAYGQSLGVFCRGENYLSRHAPVNFRFRLGNLEYVDRMEGKSGASGR